MDDGAVRQITKLPIDSHIAIQLNSVQYFAFFIGAGLSAGCGKDFYPIFTGNPDRLKGSGRDAARFGAGKGVIHITKDCFNHCSSLTLI